MLGFSPHEKDIFFHDRRMEIHKEPTHVVLVFCSSYTQFQQQFRKNNKEN